MDIALFRNEHFVGFSVPPAFLLGSHVDPRLAFVQRVVMIDAFGLAIFRVGYFGGISDPGFDILSTVFKVEIPAVRLCRGGVSFSSSTRDDKFQIRTGQTDCLG